MANMTYDPEADAALISLGAGAHEGQEVYPGVILHFDAADRIVEIEILSASKRLTPAALVGLPRALGDRRAGERGPGPQPDTSGRGEVPGPPVTSPLLGKRRYAWPCPMLLCRHASRQPPI
jgi:uncharacterized protein YuzE